MRLTQNEADPGKSSLFSRARNGPRSGGFTLVELLIVMAIMSLGIAISYPGVRRYRQAELMRAQATRLSLLLNSARARSATLNRVVRVTFAPPSLSPSNGFLAIYADRNLNLQLDSAEVAAASIPTTASMAGVQGFLLEDGIKLGRASGLPNGPLGVPVPFDGVSFTGDQVSFFPDGTAAEAGNIVLLGPAGRVYAVTVSAGGATRVYGSANGNWQ